MFVYLKAEDGSIAVSIDNEPVGCAFTAQELAEVFTVNNVSADSDIYFSSTVDFASEEGFDSDDDAHAIINGALELIA